MAAFSPSDSSGDRDLAAAAEDYRRKHSADDLHKLVHDRLGLWPRSRNTKAQNIHLLIQDDIKRGAEEARGDEPFRFLDLPAEMRNQVYDLLLTGDSRNVKKSSNTAILLACTQTCFEASSILYDEHELEIQCRTARADESGHKIEIKTAIGKTVLTVRSSRTSSLNDVYYDLQPHLRRFRNLRICLRLMTVKDTSLTVANHILARLVSFLALNAGTKKVEFQYSYEVKKAKDMTDDLKRALWPITLLTAIPKLKLTKIEGTFQEVSQYLADVPEVSSNSGPWVMDSDDFAFAPELLTKADRLRKRFRKQTQEKDERVLEVDRLSATIHVVLHARVQFDEVVLKRLNERLKELNAFIVNQRALLHIVDQRALLHRTYSWREAEDART